MKHPPRPAFDPSGYESPELAQLNVPLHPLAWDLIEVEHEIHAATKAHAPASIYNPIEARYLAARKAHEAALAQLDIDVAAYCERVEAAGGLDAYLGRSVDDTSTQTELSL